MLKLRFDRYIILWIVIYPVDSAIQRLNNRGLVVTKLDFMIIYKQEPKI